VKADLMKAGDRTTPPSMGAIGKELGLRWNTRVSPETKQKYEEMAARAKAAYQSQLAAYTPSQEFLEKRQAAKAAAAAKTAVALKKSLEQADKKMKKDPLTPKRPQSAYFLWSAANRDKVNASFANNRFFYLDQNLLIRCCSGPYLEKFLCET
jgi:hypothetical protein